MFEDGISPNPYLTAGLMANKLTGNKIGIPEDPVSKMIMKSLGSIFGGRKGHPVNLPGITIPKGFIAGSQGTEFLSKPINVDAYRELGEYTNKRENQLATSYHKTRDRLDLLGLGDTKLYKSLNKLVQDLSHPNSPEQAQNMAQQVVNKITQADQFINANLEILRAAALNDPDIQSKFAKKGIGFDQIVDVLKIPNNFDVGGLQRMDSKLKEMGLSRDSMNLAGLFSESAKRAGLWDPANQSIYDIPDFMKNLNMSVQGSQGQGTQQQNRPQHNSGDLMKTIFDAAKIFLPEGRGIEGPVYSGGGVSAGGRSFRKKAQDEGLIIPTGFVRKQPTTIARAIDPSKFLQRHGMVGQPKAGYGSVTPVNSLA